MNVDSPARFQADPNKVRVSIRRHNQHWRVTIGPREELKNGRTFTLAGETPEKAIQAALSAADGKIEGIDLELQWTYEHPFGRAGLRARR